MIDTHAHLHTSAFDRDRGEVCARAFAAGVTRILEVGIDAARWPAARAVASQDQIYLTLGIHPHDSGRSRFEDLKLLESRLGDAKVRGIGETGLDYYRDYAPHGIQRDFFVRHVALARESGLPLVVHLRERREGPSAHADALKILETEGRGRVRGVLHCFSGDLEAARRAAALGFVLGLGGGITYRPKESGPLLASIAEELGRGIFVLETDCPYQTPMPRRSDRNEPAQIPVIATALAGYLGMTRDEVEAMTDAAAQEIFQLEEP